MTNQPDRQAAIDLILDHYENPRHYGTLEEATFAGEAINPGCGDVVRLYVRLDQKQHIEAIRFEGEGCTISQAAASLLTEIALDRALEDVLVMDEDTLAKEMGEAVVHNRLPCVSVALRALKAGSQQHRENGGQSAQS